MDIEARKRMLMHEHADLIQTFARCKASEWVVDGVEVVDGVDGVDGVDVMTIPTSESAVDMC